MNDLVHSSFIRNASRLLHLRRKNSTISNLEPQNGVVRPKHAAADQAQSLFISKLPPEVRTLVYAELLRGASDVVHIVKKSKKKTEYTRCHGKCSMEYNFKCQAGTEASSGGSSSNSSNGALLPLLRTCQKAYVTYKNPPDYPIDVAHTLASHTEATPILYAKTTFDFRSFDAFTLLSHTSPPTTWSSILRIHLKWHFGYRLWCGHEDQRLRDDPVWMHVWEIMARMKGLRDIQVDLDAYLEDGVLSAEVEEEVFRPLLEVRQAGRFDVRVTWPVVGRRDREVGRGEPFRLVRWTTTEADCNIVSPVRYHR